MRFTRNHCQSFPFPRFVKGLLLPLTLHQRSWSLMVLNFITLAQPLCLSEVSVKLSPPPIEIYLSSSIESLARSAKKEQRYSSLNFTRASCSYIRPVLRCRQATRHYRPRKLFTTISSSMPVHRICMF